MTRDEIRTHVVESIVRNFDLQGVPITNGTDLFKDLELDSVDATDLFGELFTLTGSRISAEQAAHVRTVGDLIELVASQASES